MYLTLFFFSMQPRDVCTLVQRQFTRSNYFAFNSGVVKNYLSATVLHKRPIIFCFFFFFYANRIKSYVKKQKYITVSLDDTVLIKTNWYKYLLNERNC